MRCGRCGNDNVETNRFCGMCGAALVPKGQPPGPSAWPVAPVNTAPTRQAAAPVSKPIPQTSQVGLENGDASSREQHSSSVLSSHSEPARAPTISGPSFLGLQSSRANLDYLLDDEDEPRRGGKLILFVLALGLAVGFGYMHWKKGGFDWLNLGPRKAAVTASDSNQTNSDSGVPPGTVAPQNPSPSASAPAPAASAPAAPIPTDGPATNSPDTAVSSAQAQTPAPNAASQATPSPTSPSQSTSSQAAPTDSRAAPDTAQGSSTPDSENSGSGQQSADEEQSAEPAKPAPRKSPAAKPAAAKPSAARAIGAKSSDSVAEAERYIYGRGVAQDCDHGLRLLKPSAQSNPNAMISLGALYSTGTCTPRDLPTAYRWFALALHQQPDNQVLQNDLQKLWSQMTQPERQLAIKLSQ